MTQALLARGIAPERLYLVEYSADFVKLLRNRFPAVNVIQGDAYGLAETLRPHIHEPGLGDHLLAAAADAAREGPLRLLQAAFNLLLPGSPFVQFNLHELVAGPAAAHFHHATVSRRIWKNLPPARVWTYRRPTGLSGLTPRSGSPSGRSR